MKVEVVSRETIKPSCPTPPHLRTFNLSFLDQVAPPVYVPAVLFYSPASNNKTKVASSHSDLIKKSLSETLTMYYPFAGRLKADSFIIDCNDDGVDYLETRVRNNGRPLSEFIKHHDFYELSQFAPPRDQLLLADNATNSKVVLTVQVNVFNCGGIVIGLSLSHKIADASSFFVFIKDWAATARGDTKKIKGGPRFDVLPSLFPQRDLMGYMPQSMIMNTMREEEIVAKKFVFEDSKITELRKRSIAINGSIQEYPSRVEALSALIWRCFMDVDQAKKKNGGASSTGGVRVYGVAHPVNLRSRIVPPLPTNTIGNMFSVAVALSIINDNTEADDHRDKDNQYSNLVGKIKDALRKIDRDHVIKLQTTDTHIKSVKQIAEVMSGSTDDIEMVLLSFTSSCGFPSYEADFGWGRPKWVSICSSGNPIKNFIWLNDTSSGEGIEALVSFTKEDMANFERHDELLRYTKNINMESVKNLSKL
ncbi:Transferase [Macleaya cordata]|uniref:Transferase n=1 Tax=Macleaya cordata TaxID=56857 RepID=A0A200QRT4_MACCD|nr:Transferase [Macleaya cordata]